MQVLVSAASGAGTIHYTNAKAVLVGDSGVGKTGLGLVLTQQPYAATDSTHGRHVRTFAMHNVERQDSSLEIREVLLSELIDSSGIASFVDFTNLDEVAVALVVFDSRSETDPFTACNMGTGIATCEPTRL